jgi:hypothetical protein
MRAQGSLEYLIIIATVLAIVTIVVLYASGIIGPQKTSVSISTCKQAAENCKLSQMTAPTDPCTGCISACANTTVNSCSQPGAVKGVSKGAVGCCKKGRAEDIYSGSPGCGTVLHLVPGWNYPTGVTITIPSDWEQTNARDVLAQHPGIMMVVKYVDGTPYSFIRDWSSEEENFNICPNDHLFIYVYTTSAPFDMTG